MKAAALLGAATLAAFGPSLFNGFVWDDGQMIVQGSRIAGGWMPLGWAALDALRSVFGPRPVAFHAANLLAHWLACLAFFFASRMLLERARVKAAAETALGAALFFCAHPLQSGSVAWAANLPDLLSALFALLALAAYLSRDRRRLWLCGACYAVALLFRWVALALPVALLILDWWPLRRRALAEKVPFFVVAAAAACATSLGKAKAAYAPTLMPGALCRGLLVFPWKLSWPPHLLPVYTLHDAGDTLGIPGPLAIALVALAAAWLWLGRKKRPAALAAALFYSSFLLPVLLNAQTGMMFVFPKYAYLCCLPAYLLAASALARRPKGATAALVLVSIWVARVETRAWRDSISYWTRALSLDPGCRVAYGNLGGALIDAGRLNDAYFILSTQLRYNPGDAVARDNMAELRTRAPALEPDQAAFWEDEIRDLRAVGRPTASLEARLARARSRVAPR